MNHEVRLKMVSRRTEVAKLDEVMRVLSRLKGVKHSLYLSKSVRSELGRIEKRYASIGPLTVQNDGVTKCLKREHIACIVKDKSFRPPPLPTVLLVNDKGKVIGKEMLPGQKMDEHTASKKLFLGKDFVIFYREGEGKGARFVLPPVPFREVEKIDGVEHVCSSSPSTAGDFYLRNCVGLEDDPKLATILIAFDLESS